MTRLDTLRALLAARQSPVFRVVGVEKGVLDALLRLADAAKALENTWCGQLYRKEYRDLRAALDALLAEEP